MKKIHSSAVPFAVLAVLALAASATAQRSAPGSVEAGPTSIDAQGESVNNTLAHPGKPLIMRGTVVRTSTPRGSGSLLLFEDLFRRDVEIRLPPRAGFAPPLNRQIEVLCTYLEGPSEAFPGLRQVVGANWHLIPAATPTVPASKPFLATPPMMEKGDGLTPLQIGLGAVTLGLLAALFILRRTPKPVREHTHPDQGFNNFGDGTVGTRGGDHTSNDVGSRPTSPGFELLVHEGLNLDVVTVPASSRPLTVGRHPSVQILLPGSDRVSRLCGQFVPSNGGWRFIRDRKATNLNQICTPGQSEEEVVSNVPINLTDGTFLRFGDVLLEVRMATARPGAVIIDPSRVTA